MYLAVHSVSQCRHNMWCHIVKWMPYVQANNLDFKPSAPLYSYAAVSASNVMATTCQYEALRYVSFPLQTLGKCAKMIPTMIWGALILQKTYRTKDYSIALIVTAGCTLFLASGEVCGGLCQISKVRQKVDVDIARFHIADKGGTIKQVHEVLRSNFRLPDPQKHPPDMKIASWIVFWGIRWSDCWESGE